MIGFSQVTEYQTTQDVEEYYSVVCPQILALLKVDSSSGSDDAKQFGLMAVACVRAVMERSPVHGRYVRTTSKQILKPVIGCIMYFGLTWMIMKLIGNTSWSP